MRWLVALALVACGDDAPGDDAGPPDAGGGDAGDDDAGETCARAPGDAAPWRAPRAAAAACSPAEIGDYWAACVDPSAFPIACQQFTAAHAACAGCLASGEDEAAWGPLVGHAGWTEVNAGGCMVLGGADEACGDSRHALDACLGAACLGCTDDACEDDARERFCAEEAAAACGEVAGCEGYDAVAAAFCGD